MVNDYHYLIIGAGPSGLQLAYYFQKLGRKYLVLEKGNGPGTFFKKFPRHRKLISINKKHLGVLEKRTNVDHDEVRLRFDWNSLLTEEKQLRFTDYSDDYFPDADTYVRYLEDYAREYQLKIQYQTEVVQVKKRKVGVSDEDGDRIGTFIVTDQAGHQYSCLRLIVATGLSKPHIPNDIPGIELAIGYEEMSLDLEDYRNKSILIMGKGNSAFETADYLTGVSGNLKIVGREASQLAWQTHYVGDLRAVNNNYLDTYQLKSLNVIEEWDDHQLSKNEKTGQIKYRGDDDAPFDYVIRCLGWEMDHDIFDEELQLFKDKLPALHENYESVNIPGLYFTGVLSQCRDYKVSTSAFIHGFRYVSKFLAYHLEREIRNDWPRQTFKLDLDLMVGQILKLVNESSSIFQLFQHYCYIVVIREEEFDIYQEVPIDYVKNFKELEKYSFMLITMEYGFKKDENVFNYSFVNYDRYNGYNSKFVHPVIRLYPRFNQVKLVDRVKHDISLEERLHNQRSYSLCICGCYERTDELKSQTICRRCQKRAYCLCGREDTIEWFQNHNRCHWCDQGDFTNVNDHKLFGHIREDARKLDEEKITNDEKVTNEEEDDREYFHYEYHITEDVHNNFINGRQSHDLFYFIPLRRFLRTVSEFCVLNVSNFYTNTWVNGTMHQKEFSKYHGLPVQYRFWSFYSYIVVRSPKHSEEEIVKIYPRIQHILDRPEIKKNVDLALDQLYS